MANYSNAIDEFIFEICYTQIQEAVTAYIHNHPAAFTGRFAQSTYPVDAILLSFIPEFTSNITSEENTLCFDATFSSIIELISDEYSGNATKEINIWITVSCKAIIETTMERFEVTYIHPFQTKQQRETSMAQTSRNIVPYIPPEQLETEAERFLARYYPEALKKPMPIPIDQIATEKLNLTLFKAYRLSLYDSILGQICFADQDVILFDLFLTKPISLSAKRGTIFIDAYTSMTRNPGCVNNTIAHEVYHWYRHRIYASIRNILQNKSSTYQRCPINTDYPSTDEIWTDNQRMEWQATRIAPRILMPREPFLTKTNEFFQTYNYKSGTSSINVLNNIALELAEFFHVSRQSALIRLQDLGYQEAKELLQTNYALSSTKLSIDTEAAFILYQKNKSFRDLINSAKFCYINGYYVINNQKYIKEQQDHSYTLTKYAEDHIDECTLLFRKTHPIYVSPSSTLQRGYSEAYDYLDEENEEVLKKAEEQYSLFIADHAEAKTFWEVANEYMRIRKWNKTIFEECTGLVGNLFSVGHNHPDSPVAFQTAISIFAGLDLDLQSSLNLLRLAGYTLNDSPAHLAYQFVLTTLLYKSLSTKNAFLIKHNITPLGSGTYEKKIS